MKRAMESLAEILACPVCLVDFTPEGAQVPRILPCSHTTCESCMEGLFQNNSLKCPECRKLHRAESGIKSFPQNKYILAQVKKNMEEKKCEEHGNILTLFCSEERCQVSICPSCMPFHRKHDVMNIEEKEREDMKKRIDKTEESIRSKKVQLLELMREVGEKGESCVKELKKTKESVDNYFDEMIKEAKNQVKQTELQIEKEMLSLDNGIKLLNEARTVLGTKDAQESISNCQRIMKNTGNSSSKAHFWQYPIYNVGDLSMERTLGKIRISALSVEMKSQGNQITKCVRYENAVFEIKPVRRTLTYYNPIGLTDFEICQTISPLTIIVKYVRSLKMPVSD